MADDKMKSAGQDRARINVNEDSELRDRAKRIGATHEELKVAVKAVGTSAAAVEAHLKKGGYPRRGVVMAFEFKP